MCFIKYDCIGSPGTHWTFYFHDPRLSFVEFYDCFGIQPGNGIVNYLKTSNKQNTIILLKSKISIEI